MGLGDDARAEGFDFRRRRGRPHQHSVTAGALGFLDHQFWKIGQHMGQLRRISALPGRHVLQDRFFIEVETDHVGHERIHRFVVCHPRADGIGQHHVAGTVGRQQPRHTEHRFRVEGQGIEEGVVEATINHVDRFRPVGGAHVDLVVTHEQVRAFHQFHTHFPRQKRMLEERTVEAPRRQHHHARVIDRA
ncbi:hypothetical protein D3C78_1244840 [compost metagenome]